MCETTILDALLVFFSVSSLGVGVYFREKGRKEFAMFKADTDKTILEMDAVLNDINDRREFLRREIEAAREAGVLK